MLGYVCAQGKLTRLMSDLMYTYAAEAPVGTEDSDAAPAIEVPTSDKGRTAACLLVDEPAELLWVADKEGWVYGEWAVSETVSVRVSGQESHMHVGWVVCVRIEHYVQWQPACLPGCTPAPLQSAAETLSHPPVSSALQPTTLVGSPACRCGQTTACISSRPTGWATSPPCAARRRGSCGPAPREATSGGRGDNGGVEVGASWAWFIARDRQLTWLGG